MSHNGDKARTLPRPRSAAVFDGPDRAAAQAYMKGVGFDDDALSRPTIGIANTWTEAMQYSTFTCAGWPSTSRTESAPRGGTPMEFNTVAVSDRITMRTAGMKTSLVNCRKLMLHRRLHGSRLSSSATRWWRSSAPG